jgi:hypothetical protein
MQPDTVRNVNERNLRSRQQHGGTKARHANASTTTRHNHTNLVGVKWAGACQEDEVASVRGHGRHVHAVRLHLVDTHIRSRCAHLQLVGRLCGSVYRAPFVRCNGSCLERQRESGRRRSRDGQQTTAARLGAVRHTALEHLTKRQRMTKEKLSPGVVLVLATAVPGKKGPTTRMPARSSESTNNHSRPYAS